jgi:hypothetical protein
VDVRTVRIGLGALLVIALLVFGAVKIFGGDDDNGGGGKSSAPEGLSASALVDKAPDLDHTAYWLGPQPNTDQYELTTTPDGRIYVRYLTGGAKPGDPSATFTSVGTYAIPDALKALHAAEDAGGTKGISNGPGYTLLQAGNGLSVYVVFDDQPDLQVEVYSPNQGVALRLVKSGDLEPIQ